MRTVHRRLLHQAVAQGVRPAPSRVDAAALEQLQRMAGPGANIQYVCAGADAGVG